MTPEEENDFKRATLESWIEAYEWLCTLMNRENIIGLTQNDMISIIKSMRKQKDIDFPIDSES